MSARNDLPTQEAPECAYTFAAPYSRVYVSASDLDDHTGMRAAQLASLLRVMPVVGYSENMMQLARRLADDLVEARHGDAGHLLAGQLAELLLSIQGEDGPCDLLWLCQQIADELDEATHWHAIA